MEFCKHKFIITDADEYAVLYIEKHNKEYVQANIPIILQKLRTITDQHLENVRSFFSEADPDDTGYISYENIRYGCSFHIFLTQKQEISFDLVGQARNHFNKGK